MGDEMQRNAEKTGIYDDGNAKMLIGRFYKEMTDRSSKELTFSAQVLAYKIVLNDEEVFITKILIDTYYKCYSDKVKRDYAINKIKEKLQCLIDATKNQHHK